jgi:hypothetical protein
VSFFMSRAPVGENFSLQNTSKPAYWDRLLAGYVGSLFDNPFSHILAGSVGFFTKAGLLGGGSVLLGMLGLVGGAVLP